MGRFQFLGHQLVIHYKPKETTIAVQTKPVEGKDGPVRRVGVVLSWDIFHAFAEDLKSKNIEFVIEPYVRFEGLVGEQATMFFYDPSGNALEFKSFNLTEFNEPDKLEVKKREYKSV